MNNQMVLKENGRKFFFFFKRKKDYEVGSDSGHLSSTNGNASRSERFETRQRGGAANPTAGFPPFDAFISTLDRWCSLGSLKIPFPWNQQFFLVTISLSLSVMNLP